MDRGAWWGTVQGLTELDTIEQLTHTLAKNPPVNARDIRDIGLTPGSGRSLEEGMATHSSILALENPLDREPW